MAVALVSLLVAAHPLPAAAQAAATSKWSTYFGGAGEDHVTAVTQAPNGDVVIAGYTTSADVATDTGTISPDDAFVARYSANGVFVGRNVFGGEGLDEALGVTVDTDGTVYVVGQTTSQTVTRAGTKIRSWSAGKEGFLARLASDLTPTWFMYLEGSGVANSSTLPDEVARAVVVRNGVAYVAGEAGSVALLPGTSSEKAISGMSEAFAVAVTVSGAAPDILWGKIFGGPGEDRFTGIAFDTQGRLLLSGITSSSSFLSGVPSNAFHGPNDGGTDALVAKLDPALGEPDWLSYVGGSDSDEGRGVAAAPGGQILVGGTTLSQGLSADPPSAGKNAFAIWLSPEGDPIVTRTYGGEGHDEVLSVTADDFGNAYLGGKTNSPNLPLSSAAFDPSPDPSSTHEEGFITVLPQGGPGWASYVGGDNPDAVEALSLRTAPPHRLILAGSTSSSSIPYFPGGFDSTLSTGPDGFALALDVVDVTPPVPGTVRATLTTPTSISASWSGFTDPEGPITSYEWAVGTTQVPPPTQAFALATTGAESYEATNLTLDPNATNYFYVRAINSLGLTATASGLVMPPGVMDGGTGDGGSGSIDGGTSDGGVREAGSEEPDGGMKPVEHVSAVGWGCASAGDAAMPLLLGLMLLVLLTRRFTGTSR